MHYIRFLKPPRLTSNALRAGPSSLTAKITITTDLGESFLWSNIIVIAETVADDGQTVIGRAKELEWKGEDGMRALEAVLQIPARHKDDIRMLIRPKDQNLAVDSCFAVLEGKNEGGVVAVRSMSMSQKGNATSSNTSQPPLAERVFNTGKEGKDLHIWEETGESIARHIWDAGLVLSAYISTLPTTQPNLPILNSILTTKPSLKILELGAGCGIVGISLSTLPNTTQIILTDLPEATDILTQNLSSLPSDISHEVLDWSAPLPAHIAGTEWDLIAISDCTYNPDVVPDLVKTLGELARGKEVYVVLAMKVRHESELVFFELMDKKGFEVREKMKIELPVLGGEGECVEIFGFGR
ncbi:S-adenosyl-L-methionine-dependent methyltransferase [Glarea lozoyensis ATCC 20868]|uniref:S-adenosyl-L-methionine-dependent methyltransferase n=1 Tax=Glarea lozoyensis (strain ATCC 20868 / MF5171) TaxID=1116229 RepID=S3D1A7_GLAL2|nr:S-adenosyl-L-methionine-dependent methyltransferase [Glarea lozoyensis ATCC 20868]EPE31635.1 S-adenosyl-L-methionine-dependent methyltransferase [Glarea lozoyensis ATCC 20868]